MKIKIFVLFFLLSVNFIFAEFDNYFEASYEAKSFEDKGFKSGLNYYSNSKLRFKNSLLKFEKSFYYSENESVKKLSDLYNKISLSYIYFLENQTFEIEFKNNFYKDDKTDYFHINGISGKQKKKIENYLNSSYQFKNEKINLQIFNQFKTLDFENNLDGEENSERDFHNYTFLGIESYFHKNFSTFLKAKSYLDLNDNNEYDNNSFEFGLGYYNKIDFFNVIKANFSYINDQNEIEGYYYRFDSRYLKRIGTDFSGFFQYQNHFTIDSEPFSLVTQNGFFRTKFKYNLKSGDIDNSYLSGGIKYSMNSEIFSLETGINYNLFSDIYLNLESQYSFDEINKNSLKLEYYLSLDKSLWMKANYNDFENDFTEKTLFFGSTMNL